METEINDLILVYIEGIPAFFGRIEDITPDIKPGWWHVHIMVLTIPPGMISWILEKSQINGKDFTMGGVPIRIEKVISPYKQEMEIDEEDGLEAEDGKIIPLGGIKEEDREEREDRGEGKIISLMDRLKK